MWYKLLCTKPKQSTQYNVVNKNCFERINKMPQEVEPGVYKFTRDEQKQAVADALKLCGHSYDELKQMADMDTFDTLLSQRVWVAVANMSTFAPGV